MAKKQSFDITTSVDFQEVDNAVNQAIKETLTRYDFKGTDCKLELDRAAGAVKLEADDEYRLTQLVGVLREKLARRKVPLKNVHESTVEHGSLGVVQIEGVELLAQGTDVGFGDVHGHNLLRAPDDDMPARLRTGP